MKLCGYCGYKALSCQAVAKLSELLESGQSIVSGRPVSSLLTYGNIQRVFSEMVLDNRQFTESEIVIKMNIWRGRVQTIIS